jgi:hypothetical protein
MIVFSHIENRSDHCPTPCRKSNAIVTFPGFSAQRKVRRDVALRLAPKALYAHISVGHRPRNLNHTDNEALKA